MSDQISKEKFFNKNDVLMSLCILGLMFVAASVYIFPNQIAGLFYRGPQNCSILKGGAYGGLPAFKCLSTLSGKEDYSVGIVMSDLPLILPIILASIVVGLARILKFFKNS